MPDIPRGRVPRAASHGNTGMRSILSEQFNAWEAVGGVRGLVETTAPGLVFIVAFVATHQLLPSIVAPLVASLVLVLIRIWQRIDVVPALGGVLGVAVSAAWAWRSGEASGYFTLGLLTNAGYTAALLFSLAIRWPAMGVLIGFLRGDATAWRRDPDQRVTRQRYWYITWMWVGLFALRLAIQLPLYLAGATTALGIVKLAMGPGLFALLAWFTWMMVRALPPVPHGDKDPGERSAT